MALGYCSLCGKLVPITARGKHHPERTSRRWFPEMHDGKEGKLCDGILIEAGNPPKDDPS